jgi:hypothetical protein
MESAEETVTAPEAINDDEPVPIWLLFGLHWRPLQISRVQAILTEGRGVLLLHGPSVAHDD